MPGTLRLLLVVILLLLSMMASAQNRSIPPGMVLDKGLFSDVSFTETHDSSLGWSSELISDLGYDFSQKLNVGLGVPIYLVQPYSRYKTNSNPGVSYNSLGDLFTTASYKAGNKS